MGSNVLIEEKILPLILSMGFTYDNIYGGIKFTVQYHRQRFFVAKVSSLQ